MIDVRRMPRNTTAGFERIPNRAIRNVELSLAAVGLLARMLADGEQFDSIDAIADAYTPQAEGGRRKHGFGRDAYRKAALELEAAGHLVRTEEKGAGSRTRALIRAVPEKTQAEAVTESPSRARPARIDESAPQARDGKSVAGTTWENDAYEHVEPTTESPSRRPPAKTVLSARQSHDGKSVPDYIQTSLQTSDSSLSPLRQLLQDAGIELDDDEETSLAAYAKTIGDGKRKGTPWWRKVASEGDLPGIVADWRATHVAARARDSPRCPECDGRGLTEDDNGNPTLCRTCKPHRKATP